jgi:hypothetical protein
MTDTRKPKGRSPRAGSATAAAAADDLPYSIELWDENHTAVERVLGRAIRVSLARAIFLAAQKEHTGRFITLRHQDKIVAKSH